MILVFRLEVITMTNNRSKPSLKYIKFEFETLNCTSSASGGAEQAIDLSAVIDSMSGSEQGKVRIKKIRIGLRHVSEEYFAAQLVVVQTAGTWSQVLDQATYVDTILDAAISDVYGSKLIGPFQLAKRTPVNDTTVGVQTMTFAVESTRELPQHLVQLLNKEAESERLQNLLVGSIFVAGQGASQINSTYFFEIDYELTRKNIVLR